MAQAAMTTAMKAFPTTRQLRQHQLAMDNQLAQVEEINKGLTLAMDEYKFSESTLVGF
jgi:AmiR/NasT family two-component response regulator